MSYAYRCEIDDGPYAWRIDRTGDAAVSWACDAHLAQVCRRMQRDFERTELTVTAARQHGGTDGDA